MRLKLLACLSLLFVSQTGFSAGKASHVVVIVWDGMRPDFVTAETTPALFKMGAQGVTFLHHHPVFLSSTEVNATALATGVYPGQSHVVGNAEYRPEIDAAKPFGTESLKAIRKADELSDGHYLAFQTVAEILHDHHLHTVVAGTKPVALLHDRGAREEDSLGATVFEGRILPEAWEARLTNMLGEFPEVTTNKIPLDAWTTEAFTELLWEKEVPPFSMLWMGEPDYSQHQHGPGSPEALAAIKSCDDNLARVIQALKDKHAENSTDIIVVSDHGFSTILQNTDVEATLNTNGFHASRKFPPTGGQPGDVLVLGNGGTVFCYVTGHDKKLVAQIVACLQKEPSSGVIFTREPIDGTFQLSDAHLDSPEAPDIILSLRWQAGENKYGAPGLVYCDGYGLKPGQGMHVTLCPTDMHNTCLAFGPDFKAGLRDDLPSGNIDIAPTILWLLGVPPARAMSGRVLSEALNIPGPEVGPVSTRHLAVGQQSLDISSVNGVDYYDQGDVNTK